MRKSPKRSGSSFSATSDARRNRFRIFHLRDGREQIAELVGVVGVARGVIADRRMLAAAQPVGELLGQHVDRVAVVERRHRVLLREAGDRFEDLFQPRQRRT